eukprot:TRINITY_DN6747_c0_g2_i2.p1 TRINITY_DN6747_c0_g2~~TRINITY_DN6747_c0_g2_i2.p1  ORF type:complete len:697 (-),score=39.59 TRINITY_DN6747_c0_g2_i2:236-2326(-)
MPFPLENLVLLLVSMFCYSSHASFIGLFEDSPCGFCMSPNIETGGCSCPFGTSDSIPFRVLNDCAGIGTQMEAYMYMCIRYQDDGDAFQGAYLTIDTTGCEQGNPYMGGACSCTPGAGAASFRTLVNQGGGIVGAQLVLCYRLPSYTWSTFGGMFQVDDNVGGGVGCRVANPLTGGCFCPSDTRQQEFRVEVDVVYNGAVNFIGSRIYACVRESPSVGSCPIPLTSLENCGSCGVTCSRANAFATCGTRTCSIASCFANFGDCDGQDSTGCETPTNTNRDCGACGIPCSRDHAIASCASGSCAISQCYPSSSYGNCDAIGSNGCETSLTTLDNCGACGEPCSRDHAVATCATGSCAISSCLSLYGNCDSIDSNGCEEHLISLEHCGGCSAPCSRDHADAICIASNGTCAISSCHPSYDNCDGIDANGCETSLNSVNNCGGCGNVCNLPHAVNMSCMNGTCHVLSCALGWMDCDGDHSNGCERDVTTMSDCGGCAKPCQTDHGTTICSSSGQCLIVTCEPAWRGCPGNCSCPLSICGDGLCDDDDGEDGIKETCSSCSKDCGRCGRCGDGVCQFSLNETCISCPQDCGVCPPAPTCLDPICSGHGSCIGGLCDCTGSWTGPACEAAPTPIIITTNSSSPSDIIIHPINNITSSSSSSSNFSISIFGIQELDVDNVPVRNFSLSNIIFRPSPVNLPCM